MTEKPFTVTLHIVSSLDGIIARKDNSISWFETADRFEEGATISDDEREAFLKTIDCYVMGARTYEHALELSGTYGWVYGDKPTIVLSHKSLPVERPGIEIYSGDLHKLVNERLRLCYANVWVVGGAALAVDFIRAGLADELRLSVLPIILGAGLLFFDHVGREIPLHLKGVTAYRNGMVDLRYDIRK